MSRTDYYSLLGLAKGASQDEIRKAYRALARRYHPDYNPENEAANEKFLAIAEAHQVLSDDEQRQRYDRLGALYKPDGSPPNKEDLGQFISDAIGSIFKRRTRNIPGQDLEYNLPVSLEIVGHGGELPLTICREIKCVRCKGDGAEPSGGKEKCHECNGTGKLPNKLIRSGCKRCDGLGYIIVKRCKKCGGNGRNDKIENIKIKVPPGVANGQRLRVKGRGYEGFGNGKTGDLLALIAIQPHSIFERRGDDLICDVPILWSEAILGCEIETPTLTENSIIKIPQGCQSHRFFKLSGRGLPSFDGKRRGDLLYRVIVETPSTIPASAKQAIDALNKQMTEDSHPKRKDYIMKLNERKK